MCSAENALTTEETGEIVIRRITARETWSVRHSVLRPGQPLSACDYDIDNMPGSFHLGLYLDDELVCIGSFYPDPHPELAGLSQFRLRGMATLEELQGRGLGSRLLRHAEAELRDLGCDMLWCNARVSAARYYQQFGMQRFGDEFEIEHIGPHWLMFRWLSESILPDSG